MTHIDHQHACQGPDHAVSRRQVLGTLAGGSAGVGLGSLLNPVLAEEIKIAARIGIAEAVASRIIDDLLATGGTAKAAAKLVEKLGAKVVGFAFIIELTSLKGTEKIKEYRIESLVEY